MGIESLKEAINKKFEKDFLKLTNQFGVKSSQVERFSICLLYTSDAADE